MIFIVMLLAAALALASAAGYFSVSGLSETYAASAISIIIMGTCLEASKLVLASFIHKYWKKINFALKAICCTMLVILMFITSYGVFGHLTSAYQQDSAPLSDISQKLTQDKAELDRLIDRKKQMDDQVAKLPNSYVRARSQLIKSFGQEYNTVPARITELNTEISTLSSKQLTTETKIGPIIYMAKVLGQDPDKTIFYFTFLITLVFDPLAVTLVFAYNIALNEWRLNKTKISEPVKELVIDEPKIQTTDIVPYEEDIMSKMYSALRNNKKPVD